MEENFIDVTKLNQIHIESYMKKEELINMLSNLKFVGVKYFDIDFIKAFEYDSNENKIYPRGFNISYR